MTVKLSPDVVPIINAMLAEDKLDNPFILKVLGYGVFGVKERVLRLADVVMALNALSEDVQAMMEKKPANGNGWRLGSISEDVQTVTTKNAADRDDWRLGTTRKIIPASKANGEY
ncbi:MAG: hypothetical protein WD688_17285 [Candidatus Binatia bacterium]